MKHFDTVSGLPQRGAVDAVPLLGEVLVEISKEVIGHKMTIDDTVVGKARDVLVEEPSWDVRFLVVGKKLGKGWKLVDSEFVSPPDAKSKRVPIRLTKEQFEGLADSEALPTVSDEEEAVVAEAFGDVDYRSGGGPMAKTHGVVPPQTMAWAQSKPGRGPTAPREESRRSSLRSVGRMSNHSVETEDGKHYPVLGVLADPSSWVLRYIVVDMRNWKPGTQVLVPMAWIQHIGWSESRIYVRGRTQDLRRSQRFSRHSHDDLSSS